MTEEKRQQFEKRIAALNEKYCAQLPDKYLEIQDSWRKYQTDFSNPEFIETFYRLIHTLKGTAATFGFTTQADTCFKIQKILMKAKEDNTVLSESSAAQIQERLIELEAKINTPAEDIAN